MEDKKREGSLPRTLASSKIFSRKLSERTLAWFFPELLHKCRIVIEYHLKEEHEK